MTVVPTLVGRLQTRLFTMLVFGLPWTLLFALVVTPVVGLGHALAACLFAWAATLVVGLVLWEPLYHALMQFRWEKDWPMLFVLLEGLPEAVLVWVLLNTLGPGAPAWVFVLLFASTWLLIFAMLNGPMRVIALRWRFRGGRLL